MANIRFEQPAHTVLLVSPVDTVATAFATPFVDLKNYHWASFFVFAGTITGDSIDITIEASTAASSGSETAIGFKYRKSSALGTDSWGAVTAGTSDGVALAAADDDKCLMIDVDPAEVSAKSTDMRFVRLVGTPGSTLMTACEVAVWAVLEPRYPRTTQLSSS